MFLTKHHATQARSGAGADLHLFLNLAEMGKTREQCTFFLRGEKYNCTSMQLILLKRYSESRLGREIINFLFYRLLELLNYWPYFGKIRRYYPKQITDKHLLSCLFPEFISDITIGISKILPTRCNVYSIYLFL